MHVPVFKCHKKWKSNYPLILHIENRLIDILSNCQCFLHSVVTYSNHFCHTLLFSAHEDNICHRCQEIVRFVCRYTQSSERLVAIFVRVCFEMNNWILVRCLQQYMYHISNNHMSKRIRSLKDTTMLINKKQYVEYIEKDGQNSSSKLTTLSYRIFLLIVIIIQYLYLWSIHVT